LVAMISFQPRLAPSSSMTPHKNTSFAFSFEGRPKKDLAYRPRPKLHC
jgi:hypothetical protein